ncbi:MAG: MotA/TolQ/ExbB proton channel family protein [Cytophagales bacterium]|nr:MotA/TolQ/ExbB proton channel family protein [Cytophagales bacterium]
MVLSILLQITEAATTEQVAVDTTNTAQSLTFLELLMKGGFIMIPIGLLSVATLYFIVERYLAISKASKFDANFLGNIREMILKGDFNSARMICKSSDTPAGRIIDKGISRIGKPMKDIENAMESMANIELSKVEKNLGFLGIIASIAPMLGFVGTISGVIKIFYNISIADNISIGLIAGGLYEKMITSFAGLIVGIFAYAGYHYLNIMIDKLTLSLNTAVVDFIDMLQEPQK